MVVLGLDAAATTGWGVIDTTGGPPRLLSWGKCNAKDHLAIVEVVTNAAALGATLAAIETPYVDENIDTAIKLGVTVGRWVQELERAGVRWTGHKAQSWQHHVLAGLIGPSSPREQRKAAAIRYVLATFKVKVEEDAADAICLATWRAKKAHLDQIARRA